MKSPSIAMIFAFANSCIADNYFVCKYAWGKITLPTTKRIRITTIDISSGAQKAIICMLTIL